MPCRGHQPFRGACRPRAERTDQGLRQARLHRQPLQNAFIESFNGSLRDELLNEEIFDSLDDARRKLALWRYDYNTVRPHSSLANQTPQQARRTLEQFEGSAPGALAQDGEPEYPNSACRLSL